MFCCEFIAARSTYNEGKMTQDDIFEALKTAYKTKQAAGTCANLMPSLVGKSARNSTEFCNYSNSEPFFCQFFI